MRKQDGESQREREALLKVHEVAAAWFREQLAAPAGAAGQTAAPRSRLSAETIEQLGIGYAPGAGPARAAGEGRLRATALLPKSGLLVQRDGEQARDRFRNRLMIPICRDTGAIVAFGGRAMEEGQQPKYLNSPETRDLRQGTDALRAEPGARRRSAVCSYAVLVEGYFDWAQAYQAGSPTWSPRRARR